MENIEKELAAELHSRHAVRLRNDVNGNPRFCLHWTFLEGTHNHQLDIMHRYERVLREAKKLGGRKHHTKSFGGGVVFQCYEFELPAIIAQLRRVLV